MLLVLNIQQFVMLLVLNINSLAVCDVAVQYHEQFTNSLWCWCSISSTIHQQIVMLVLNIITIYQQFWVLLLFSIMNNSAFTNSLWRWCSISSTIHQQFEMLLLFNIINNSPTVLDVVAVKYLSIYHQLMSAVLSLRSNVLSPTTMGLFSEVLWRQSLIETEPVGWNRQRKDHSLQVSKPNGARLGPGASSLVGVWGQRPLKLKPFEEFVHNKWHSGALEQL